MEQRLRLIREEPSEFATAFMELYIKVITALYDLKCQTFLEGVKKELKSIRRLKHFITSREKEFFVDVKYEQPKARCAYMYSYGVLDTSVAYLAFMGHLQNNRHMFLHEFSSETLKICCLGSGTGFEAVGILKAIHDVIWNLSSKDENSVIDVHITVVDICPEWSSEVFAIVNELKSTKLFPTKKIQFHANFFQADLLNPFEETLGGIIEEANITTIFKFVNTVQEKNPAGCIPTLQNMITRVANCIAEGCCLFILDTAGGKVFYHSIEILSKIQNDYMYKLITHKKYRLHRKILKELESVMDFRSYAGDSTLFPTQLTKVSSCIWVKKNSNSQTK